MINMEKLFDLIDLFDIAAKSYPLKAMAFELGKTDSTLRNELTQQHGFKLGILDAILIMKKSHDTRPLDTIEEYFNRVAFELPRAERKNMQPVMHYISQMSKEFGENIEQMAEAMKDGVVTSLEAKRCLKENKDLIKACVELQAYLEQFINQKVEY